MAKVFFGLDLSKNATGLVGINEAGKVIYSKIHVVLSVPNFVEGVAKMAEEILDAINKYSVGLADEVYLAIEGLSFGSRGRATHDLGQIRGIVEYILRDSFSDITEIAPTALKKFVTGKGNAQKELMLMKILKEWEEEFENHNLGDAYSLAQVVRHKVLMLKCKKHQQEVLEKVELK